MVVADGARPTDADPLRPARVPRPPPQRFVTQPVKVAELRERAVAAQGFAAAARAAEVETIIDRLSAVQLDSISAVERAHR